MRQLFRAEGFCDVFFQRGRYVHKLTLNVDYCHVCERTSEEQREKETCVSVSNRGCLSDSFPRARAQTNKRTNEESSSRKNLGGKKKTKRCLVSHLFTRDGEHDRADAGRTSQAHSEEYYSLSRVMCLLPPGERKKCEVWCACFIQRQKYSFS